MSLLLGLRKDVSWKFMGEVLSRFVFFFFFLYVGRKLYATEFGTLNLAISATYMLGVLFLDAGLCIAAIQHLVNYPEARSRTAGTVLVLKCALLVPFLLILLVMMSLFGERLPALPLMLYAAFYTFTTHILEYLSAVTNAYHRMDLEAVFKISNRVCTVLFGVAALRFHSVGALLISMMTAGALCCATAAWVVWRQCVRFQPALDFRLMLRLVLSALPVGGTLVVSAIYLKWDLLVLSAYNISREQLGWYASAYKLVEAFSSIPGILGAALFPTMVRLSKEDRPGFIRLLLMTTKIMLLCSLPVAACISALSEPLIGLIYGPEYVPGAAVLSVLIWCIVPIFLYLVMMYVNVSVGMARYNMFAGIAALMFGLIANMLLIPKLGFVGAAWAALIANTAFAAIVVWKIISLCPDARMLVLLAKLSFGGLVLGLLLKVGPWPLDVRVFVALLGYTVSTLALGNVNSSDLSLAVRLLRPSRLAMERR
jgi:O-antigen/teichoic acid export membrane protein